MVDQSWTLGGGPGHWLYEIYDGLRRGLNKRITGRLARLALDGSPGIVIEAGSGTGFATTLFAEEKNAMLSIAVDYDLAALKEGRKTDANLVAVVADVHHLPFRDGVAQLVWNSSTIEHLDDQAAVTQEMARVVKSGGAVFVGVPYKWGPLFFQRWIAGTGVGVWLGTVYGAADVSGWLRGANCDPFADWRYFFRFFVGVIGRKS
jgi:SAM-dependent methyltransferase